MTIDLQKMKERLESKQDVGYGTSRLLRVAKARWPIYLKGNRFISHT